MHQNKAEQIFTAHIVFFSCAVQKQQSRKSHSDNAFNSSLMKNSKLRRFMTCNLPNYNASCLQSTAKFCESIFRRYSRFVHNAAVIFFVSPLIWLSREIEMPNVCVCDESLFPRRRNFFQIVCCEIRREACALSNACFVYGSSVIDKWIL